MVQEREVRRLSTETLNLDFLPRAVPKFTHNLRVTATLTQTPAMSLPTCNFSSSCNISANPHYTSKRFVLKRFVLHGHLFSTTPMTSITIPLIIGDVHLSSISRPMRLAVTRRKTCRLQRRQQLHSRRLQTCLCKRPPQPLQLLFKPLSVCRLLSLAIRINIHTQPSTVSISHPDRNNYRFTLKTQQLADAQAVYQAVLITHPYTSLLSIQPPSRRPIYYPNHSQHQCCSYEHYLRSHHRRITWYQLQPAQPVRRSIPAIVICCAFSPIWTQTVWQLKAFLAQQTHVTVSVVYTTVVKSQVCVDVVLQVAIICDS